MTANNVAETCEIHLVWQKKEGPDGLLGVRDWSFEATAIGPNGRYSAGKEKLEFGKKGDYVGPSNNITLLENSRDKLDNLIKKLYAEGWESTGCGKVWYNARFRRITK